MTRRQPWLLLLLASLLASACGVPISAADLTMTPENSESIDSATLSSSITAARGLQAAPTASAAIAPTPGALTTQAPLPASTTTATATPSDSTTPVATPTASRTPTPGTPTPTATPPLSAADMAAQAAAILNKSRTDRGLPALRVDASLTAAAMSYAKILADSRRLYCVGCDFHTGPDGSQPEGRIASAGYAGQFLGEAIHAGSGTPQGAINAWLASAPHAAILLDSGAADIGIGYYYKADGYVHYWVLLTGR